MRLIVMLLGLLVAALPTSAGLLDLCPGSSTLAGISSISGGCVSGDRLFSAFSYENVVNGPGTTGLNVQTNNGVITFSGPWELTGPDQQMEFVVRFTVTGLDTDLNTITLVSSNIDSNFGNDAHVLESVWNGTKYEQVGQVNRGNEGPTSFNVTSQPSLMIEKRVQLKTLNNVNTDAVIADFSQSFSFSQETSPVPEPTTVCLMLAGIVGMALKRKVAR